MNDDLIKKFISGDLPTEQANGIINSARMNQSFANQIIELIAKEHGVDYKEFNDDDDDDEYKDIDEQIAGFAVNNLGEEQAKKLIQTAMKNHVVATEIIATYAAAKAISKLPQEKKETLGKFFEIFSKKLS